MKQLFATILSRDSRNLSLSTRECLALFIKTTTQWIDTIKEIPYRLYISQLLASRKVQDFNNIIFKRKTSRIIIVQGSYTPP